MMILDTHTWFWLVTEHARLSVRARDAIARDGDLGVSSISLWEIAMLERKGRITLNGPVQGWLEDATGFAGLRVLPITPVIAAESAVIPLPHGDPADRLIVATARVHNVPLITKDGKITESGLVDTRW